MENRENTPLLEVKGLKKTFVTHSSKGKRTVNALSGVSFSVQAGETFGLVGESGCGKTTVGRVICCLTEPTEGQVLLEGQDLYKLSRAELKKQRKNIQMIFQDPFASLDPRMTIGQIVEEPLVIYGIGDKKSRRKSVEEFLERVGLQPSYYDRYPHETVEQLAANIRARRPCNTPSEEICGIDAAALRKSIVRWNELCREGVDADFHRDRMHPIQDGPYYAIELCFSCINTQGGPAKNEWCQTITPYNEVIPHLYNCGECGSYNGFLYTYGNLLEALTTGRMAVHHALGLPDTIRKRYAANTGN